MSIDNVSSTSSGQPIHGASANQDVESADKTSPSGFDRVMDEKTRADKESVDEKHAAEETKGKKKPEKKMKKDVDMKDFSSMFSLRARTMERPTGSQDVSAIGKLPRKVMDEVVQAVRVGVNRMGDKEVQFDLKSNVMDGMRVRVSMHENKVMTTLEVTTLDAKNLLEANLGELKQMLAQKGLDIADVNIQFKEEQAQQRREDSSQRQDQQDQQDEEDETY